MLTHLQELKEIRNQINSDDLLWDFGYIESLIDTMNDEELRIFSELGKLMMVKN